MRNIELMYTPADKRLFWVAGYTADGNTSSVKEMVSSLLENAQLFANAAGCHVDDVKTYYNDRPPRYQYMRVFWIETETPPENMHFKWSEGWDMYKVLTY